MKFEVKPALLMGGRLALFHYSFSQVSEITFSVLFPAGKGDRFVFMGEDPNNIDYVEVYCQLKCPVEKLTRVIPECPGFYCYARTRISG